MVLALAAGSTFAVWAVADEPQLLNERLEKVSTVRHMYINMRTGERIITTGENAARISSTSVWENMDITTNGHYFWGMDNATNSFPDGTPGPRIGSEALNWGDIGRHLPAGQTATVVDCYRVTYGTGVIGSGTATDPVVGFSIINAWYNDESGYHDTTFNLAQAIKVPDIPGADPAAPPGTFAGWILTVDLAGTSLVFTLDGADEDLGGTHDFGWSYAFEQNQIEPLGTTGPFLVVPAEDGPEGLGWPLCGIGSSYGLEDIFDWFRRGPANGGPFHNNASFQGSFFLSQFYCIPATDPLFAPYLSFGMDLFSPPGSPVCPADCTGDGALDVLDFFAFVVAFNTGVPDTPCPDNDGNGVLDVLDFFAFVGQFAAGCP